MMSFHIKMAFAPYECLVCLCLIQWIRTLTSFLIGRSLKKFEYDDGMIDSTSLILDSNNISEFCGLISLTSLEKVGGSICAFACFCSI